MYSVYIYMYVYTVSDNNPSCGHVTVWKPGFGTFVTDIYTNAGKSAVSWSIHMVVPPIRLYLIIILLIII